MSNENVKQLLEFYFEGKTSSHEEKILRNYFSGENTNPEWDCYKPLFQYFKEERDLRKEQEIPIFIQSNSRRKIILWFSVGAAACMTIFFGIKNNLSFPNTQIVTSVVYIDGKKHIDMPSIRSELFQVLDDLQEENEFIFSSQIDILNNLSN
jgi:hypothetical protein